MSVELASVVAPVATAWIDLSRLEQLNLVVVTQRRDGQAGRRSERTDVEQIIITVHPSSFQPQAA
jgi:hypothetical protein